MFNFPNLACRHRTQQNGVGRRRLQKKHLVKLQGSLSQQRHRKTKEGKEQKGAVFHGYYFELKVNKTPALGRILATKTGQLCCFQGSFSTFKQIEKGGFSSFD
jgi:hypothetical protein